MWSITFFQKIRALSMSEVNKLKTLLRRKFDMKNLVVAKKIIGVEICRARILENYGYLITIMLRKC